MYRGPDYYPDDVGFGETPMLGEWKITRLDADRNVISISQEHNLIVNTGREQMIRLLMGFTSGEAGTPFIAMAVGASATTAVVGDTRLEYELIGNATRKALTNVSNVTLTSGGTGSDIESESIQVAGELAVDDKWTFKRKIRVRATYEIDDGNNGNTFREYGLTSTLTKPGTPTSTSGNLFNRFIDPNPTPKTSGETIIAEFTLRF